jgi:hypothetical protein
MCVWFNWCERHDLNRRSSLLVSFSLYPIDNVAMDRQPYDYQKKTLSFPQPYASEQINRCETSIFNNLGLEDRKELFGDSRFYTYVDSA